MGQPRSLFLLDEYRQGLLFVLDRSERQGKKVHYQTLAENIRVQKSYFSKVMNGYADLSSDQMYLVCQFLKLPDNEAEFLLLLLERERSSVADRQNELSEKIAKIRKVELDTGKQIGNIDTPATSVEVGHYYMNPYLQILNQALEVEKFAKDPDLLRQQLNLSADYFYELLRTLEKDGFIEFADSEYRSLGRDIHLPKDNPLFSLWINKQRMMSVTKMTSLPSEDYMSFDILFASNTKASQKIQERFRVFLDEAKDIAVGSKKEQVFQMGFDIMPWTEK